MNLASALVLSGSIGKGHDSVAEACRSGLSSRGLEAEVLDCMALLGGPGARVGTAVFRTLISNSSVYDAFHFSHLRTGGWLPSAIERAASHRLVPELLTHLDRLERPTVALSVFPTGVSAAGRLKERLPELAVVAMCTDACAHQMWIHPGVDLYVTCSLLAATTVRRYDAGANVCVIPPPVRPAFYTVPTKEEARTGLGLPRDEPCVLLMGGGWGLGPLAQTSATLARNGFQVLAVAGLNDRLHTRLRALSRAEDRIHPFGFTDQVPELVAASDVVVTPPGQTCNETRVVGRSLVVLDVVPGHGRENALHEIESGDALSCSPEPNAVLGAVRFLLGEQPDRVPWPSGSKEEWDKHFFAALEEVGLTVAT
ncbi:MAG TPA: hypothetical protein VHY77_01245 [Acidimicrobiales bacterium]|nr:hypothetical protein [Acidimicrobiales bacterium]